MNIERGKALAYSNKNKHLFIEELITFCSISSITTNPAYKIDVGRITQLVPRHRCTDPLLFQFGGTK